MAWNPNIPQPGDLISQSQDQILQNFQALDPLFQGIDQFVLLPVQGAGPVTAANQIAVYSKTSPNTLAPELYIRRANSGTELQISGSAGGWTFLSSGLLMKWGTDFVINPAGATAKTFPTSATIPVFNTIGTMQITTFNNQGGPQIDSDTFVRFISATATGYSVWCSQRTAVAQPAGNYNWNWLAIGIPV